MSHREVLHATSRALEEARGQHLTLSDWAMLHPETRQELEEPIERLRARIDDLERQEEEYAREVHKAHLAAHRRHAQIAGRAMGHGAGMVFVMVAMLVAVLMSLKACGVLTP